MKSWNVLIDEISARASKDKPHIFRANGEWYLFCPYDINEVFPWSEQAAMLEQAKFNVRQLNDDLAMIKFKGHLPRPHNQI